MFIEQYRLESNPFDADRVRPHFSSHSYRYASTKVAQLLHGQIQCLFISGAAGVGKTTLVEDQLRSSKNITVSWPGPGIETPEDLLDTLVRDLGPGAVEGTLPELRNILRVFLQHQAAFGRRSLIVADGLERDSTDVIREFEDLGRARLRGRPVIQMILVTRNEELAANLLGQHESTPLGRAVHQRFTGFTLEETVAYMRTALHGAGCTWFEELFPGNLCGDVQAFTQGIVGDIDALCREALDLLALRSRNAVGQPHVTQAILKEAAAKLHLRYDAASWKLQQRSETDWSPDSVRLSDHDSLRIEAARLMVSSGEQLLAEIALNRPRMVLGRDLSCDISLDSSYVSRYQNLFMETEHGWVLIDLNSTNGCFVNGRRVNEHYLRDGDLISIGQHQLRFTGTRSMPAKQPPAADPAEDTLLTPGLRRSPTSVGATR